MGNGGSNLIRECALSIIRATDKHADVNIAVEDFMPSVRRLAERPDLLTLGVTGVPVHLASRTYLYLDDAMQIILAKMPNNYALPVHDHGWGWELCYIYRGELQQKVYDRVDDGTRLGFAELRLVDDRILKQGDFSLMVPPRAENHTLIGRAEDTYVLGIIGGGWPARVRRYFQPERGTYIERPAGLS